MDSKSFTKLLRKIIREEVKSAVRQVLTEETTSHKQVMSHVMQMHEMANSRPKKSFTKNSMLNDLLNETAATPVSQEMTDWSTMNFKSEMSNAFGSPKMSTGPLTNTGINGEPVNMQKEGVAATVNAMTKDYSALMKAIDKKRSNK